MPAVEEDEEKQPASPEKDIKSEPKKMSSSHGPPSGPERKGDEEAPVTQESSAKSDSKAPSTGHHESPLLPGGEQAREEGREVAESKSSNIKEQPCKSEGSKEPAGAAIPAVPTTATPPAPTTAHTTTKPAHEIQTCDEPSASSVHLDRGGKAQEDTGMPQVQVPHQENQAAQPFPRASAASSSPPESQPQQTPEQPPSHPLERDMGPGAAKAPLPVEGMKDATSTPSPAMTTTNHDPTGNTVAFSTPASTKVVNDSTMVQLASASATTAPITASTVSILSHTAVAKDAASVPTSTRPSAAQSMDLAIVVSKPSPAVAVAPVKAEAEQKLPPESSTQTSRIRRALQHESTSHAPTSLKDSSRDTTTAATLSTSRGEPATSNLEFLRAAAHAVAVEDSLNSTDALLSATRAVFGSPPRKHRSEVDKRPTSAPPIMRPSPPSLEPPRDLFLTQLPSPSSSPHDSKPLSPEPSSPKPATTPVRPSSEEAVAPSKKKEEEEEEGRSCRRRSSKLESDEEDQRSDNHDADKDKDGSTRSRRRKKELLESLLEDMAIPRFKSRRKSHKERKVAGDIPLSENALKLQRLANQAHIFLTEPQIRVLDLTKSLSHVHSSKSVSASRSIASLLNSRTKELAQPLKAEGKGSQGLTPMERKLLRYPRFEDAKECVFRPKLRARRGGQEKKEEGSDDDDDAQNQRSSFADRQEAKERARRKDLDTVIKKRDYDARLNKKSCPGCGLKQSYDEWVEKRKSCPNCHVEYRLEAVWSKYCKEFLARQKEFEATRDEHRQAMIEEEMALLGTFDKIVYNPQTGKMEMVPGSCHLLWEEVADQFFERMAEYEKKKEERLKRLEEEEYEDLGCPAQSFKRKVHDDDDDAEEGVWGYD